MSGLRRRPVTEGDRELLYRIYASSREDELAVLDWDDSQKESFLRMQFEAQSRHYAEHFAGASFDMLELDGELIGRLYVERRTDELRIIDIALLSDFRGRGIGSGLIQGILDEAATAGKAVRIHVERNNPALRLYHRLGFKEIGEEGVYWLMEWCSPDQAKIIS